MIEAKAKKIDNTNGHGLIMRTSRNDLPEETRQKIVGLLNEQLADTFDLLSHAKQAHWNVRGPHFIALHKLFDEVYSMLGDHVDTIAERATALGGVAMGTVRMAATNSRLEEYPAQILNGMDHVRALSDRMANLCASTREAIEVAINAGDQGTGDLFIEVVRDLDKYLWFVEAHLRSD